MLIPLLQQNQNVVPVQPTKLPRIDIDRGGGGPLIDPRYDIIDFIEATNSFPEIAGEHPVARAARRVKYLKEAIPKIAEQRKNREAAAFVAGATLGDAAAEDRIRAEQAEKLILGLEDLPKLLAIIDEIRGVRPVQAGGNGWLIGLGLLGVGVVAGFAIARRRSRQK